MESLKEVLIEELKDLYSAEKQLVKALPKIARGADSTQLREAISEHLEVTKGQVSRLEEVFSRLEQKPRAKPCKGMAGLLSEAAGFLEEEDGGPLRDLQLIGAAQRVEHYGFAAYGTAKAMAEKLGFSEVTDLLNEALEEEEEADRKLTEVAENIYGEVDANESSAGEEEQMAAPSARRKTAAKKRH